MTTTLDIPGGPAVRLRGAPGGPCVLLFGGSTHRDGAGTWSPTTEWLARRLARVRGGRLRIAEVRYRHSSWQRLETSVADGALAVAALREARTPARITIGFSLGGAVAVTAAADETVVGVVGLAAWLPPRIDLRHLAGRRLRLLHGTLDGRAPGLPGVPPHVSEWAAHRARQLGVDVEYTAVRGGIHGLAVRGPWGRLLPLPRARRWAALVEEELDRLLGDRPAGGPG